MAYTITFKNYDGTTLQTLEVEEGVTPAYSGETPVRAADAQYTYTFNGWTPEIVAASADAEYTAEYTATVNEYEIVFKDEDGTVLQSSNVPYGSTPSYTGETPSGRGGDYVFAGWNPTVAAVTGAAIYTATYAIGYVIVRQDHSMGGQNRRCVVQLRSASEVSIIPNYTAPGSVAYLPDMTKVWVKDNDGSWTQSTSDALALIGLI